MQYKCVTDAQKRKSLLPGRCAPATWTAAACPSSFAPPHGPPRASGLQATLLPPFPPSNIICSGLEYVDASGTSHPAVPAWTFTAADGVEMPLEEGTSAFITMNPGYIGAGVAACWV